MTLTDVTHNNAQPTRRKRRIRPDDTARVHLSDPLSSHEAADSITREGLFASQQHVLSDLRLYGRSAAWEIVERAEIRALKWSGSRLRTAITEVEESGLVTRYEMTGKNPAGYRVDEFELTNKGRGVAL